jgi:putative GTP pyrophosphokinase
MKFTQRPNYSKRRINLAAQSLVELVSGTVEYEEARSIVNDYRTCHVYPLNTFKSTLRKKVRKYKDAIVAQRLKRLPTIIDKLSRYPTMNLTQMQDIGGLRAVLPTIGDVRELQESYTDNTRFNHKLILEHDYIENPKSDGYRGVHLVFKYQNRNSKNIAADQYNDLPIELQIRTQLQHSWATAVETVGTLKSESFKTGRGPKVWREFFELVSSAFAIAEGAPVLAQHQQMTASQLFKQIRNFDGKHHLIDNLRGLATASNVIDGSPHAGYYNIVKLDIPNKRITVYSYNKSQLDEVTKKYAELEAEADDSVDIVLVSVTNIATLKKAYPNYFLDVSEFVEKISVLTED